MSLENKFTCPVCLNNTSETLIDFGNIPKSGTFLLKPEEHYLKIGLKFDFCTKCSLIYLNQSNFKDCNYTNINRRTSHQLPRYTNKIIETLKNKLYHNDFIIEVGANDGTFLDNIKSVGFVNLLGVEPSKDCSQICASKGHNVENIHLNEESSNKIIEKYGKAKAVICRHTIEHTQNPREFLTSIQNLLQGKGITFIETPNSHEIIYNVLGHELWDEHLYYFSKKNLEILAKNLNFKIDKTFVYPHLMTSNILLFAFKDFNKKEKYSYENNLYDINNCRKFSSKWDNFCNKINSEIKNYQKPVIGIGASHPQTNFFIFSKIGENIDTLIDDDCNKIGKYVPLPKPVKIMSTKEFMNGKAPGTILLTAFGYESWMKKICNKFENVKIINPYEVNYSDL